MSKLVVPVRPLPGESLPGLIARAAEVNGYHRAGMVLEIAGLSALRSESVASRPIDAADDIARVLGTDPEEIRPLFQPALNKTYFDFHGVRIRSALREVNFRRVSPRALKLSPHHRAIWQIKPLSFDPVTKETLLDHCPVCASPLDFIRTFGLCFCHQCVEAGELSYGLRATADLRDHPQTIIEIDDVEALDFVTGLIDPEQAAFRGSRTLHDDLAGLNSGELFELALSLGTAARLNRSGIEVAEKELLTSKYGYLSPEGLALAGRTLLEWPRRYIELCECAAAGAEGRTGKFSRRKEIGALANLAIGPALSRKVKLAVRQAESLYLEETQSGTPILRKGSQRLGREWISMTEIMEQLYCYPKVLNRLRLHQRVNTRFQDDDPRAPVMFDSGQIMHILKEVMELTGERECAVKLGLPVHAIEELGNRGYLRRVEGIAADVLSYEKCYCMRSLDFLIGKLKKDINLVDLVPGDPGPDFVPVSEVMLRYRAGRKPWAPLVEAMITGRVEVKLHREPTKGLMNAISVKGAEDVYDALIKGLGRYSEPKGAVPLTSALLMLNITKYDQLSACLRQGLLKLNEDKLLPIEQILGFSKEYILQGEIGARAGVPRLEVVSWTEERGLHPEIDPRVSSGRVFRREDVEPYLDRQPWDGSSPVLNALPDELHPYWTRPRGALRPFRLEGYPAKFRNQRPDWSPEAGFYAQRKARADKIRAER